MKSTYFKLKTCMIIFFQADGNGPDSSEADHCIIHYVIVDVWDKDTLNRDDFMGRVMVPVSFLSQQPLCGWFSLGRTNVRDTSFTGEIYLELAIESLVVSKIIYVFARELNDRNLYYATQSGSGLM